MQILHVVRRLGLIVCLMIAVCALVHADVDSGPAVNEKMPPLTLPVIVGNNAGQETDWLKARGAKPTVYFFIRTDKFTRPSARVIKKFDQEVAQRGDTKAVAVWLTDNQNETEKHLPLVQQSLQFENTTLCLHDSNRDGPNNWGINADADLTAVVIAEGKVVKRFGWIGPNETVVKDLIAALPVKM
jgi:hypothetical protein